MEYGYLGGAGGGFEGGCLGAGGGELPWGELASCGQMSQAAYRYQGMRYQPPPPQCARPQDAAMRNHHIFPPTMNLQHWKRERSRRVTAPCDELEFCPAPGLRDV
ncbi:hypothetical protein EVAR_51852_1 [Eumeta japonica]|uniref:Uncharacterized protein n=1 Tax=Eumeta variegata TaxID=151549 RepID=A0A4C1YNT3_EUMVA|nr:hypothetical protein EVAR_51852_1 [Eumeta japonica]